MTALKDIAKIETTGLWRADEDAQRIEVFVSVGDGSLIITDISNTALSHWALAAVHRRNPGKRPAIYAPGRDTPEELEIEDATMIDAIERIRTAIDRTRPHPGRLRVLSLLAITVTLLALALFWVPKALRDHTLSVLPGPQQVAIGQSMLSRITTLTGPACSDPQGLEALRVLNARVLPQTRARIVVLPNLPKPTMHLPGGHIIVSADLLDPGSAAEAVAGHILTASLRADLYDTLSEYLTFAGFRETFRLLTSGETNPETLRRYVDLKLTRPATEVDDSHLLDAFSARSLPVAPYARSLPRDGPQAARLVAADPFANQPAPEVLSDTDWLTLANICQ
ncbi:hypothetical protein [Thalassobacter stenotrophicus]|uniref:Uncharacterized protein n=2 Tax=Thalassobacter stenotrophicus TaxID=266809 RepID=A0A0P1FGY0_9RHOB|nr:hypothetical protein [Thalassobacter stenotrophicus]PVZ48291.1 hypothetical protein DD557_05810 [Thalassobacter stenotrophicus]CUH61185.1 hypothetical protein THS5294_02487 [Thalassobacter stenotrophicus]SHI59036.1 hypothetical protein SAMN02744035_01012 [Thalassobacter stenotrophicus DSM 16310]